MVSLEYLPLVGQDMKTCGGLGLQTLGLTGLSCIVKCALERGGRNTSCSNWGSVLFRT
jgi:hypothetical protein